MEQNLLPFDFIESMAEVIKIIGHPQRLRILEYLDINGEMTVNAITESIHGQQGAISQHLNKMRMAGIISCRRDGRQVYYKVSADSAITIIECMRRKCQLKPQ
ncbi:MAG: metalloregulator ArsR/SmtB family transcription factor [Victivallaceae bacterium]|jgi:ArsR family transcriptional regulator|nr:metalloregulator ArsR/SmtB family transcription factor [Victivallaceae bacterium]NLK83206.1 winged helix-turn-helix transcriptional regulator [Lentisphaerota bacterium]MDD3117450.1 metalloregulator ArsR/SmtB family transcription factor [Victivallaceae bacterium]MDD3704160.1 metalloregulator ArsR/SmtB family transcription factor [Victivallaceae bacterium]MDD4318211.1 metalloregulator ArsR/SmtB family transcription factor [Victivallaceae bacterium]